MRRFKVYVNRNEGGEPINEWLTPENHPGPYYPREADEHPPRCPECSGIVRLDFQGQQLPPGVGFCPQHYVVRYFQGRRDDERRST